MMAVMPSRLTFIRRWAMRAESVIASLPNPAELRPAHMMMAASAREALTLSDVEGEAWVVEQAWALLLREHEGAATWLIEHGADLADVNNLRAPNLHGTTVWHLVAQAGRTDVLRWLEDKGLLDMINDRDRGGDTPLIKALNRATEGAARWLIEHGADITAVDDYYQATAFHVACNRMSFAFVQDLADKVPPGHLTQADKYGMSPMRAAAARSSASDGLRIVSMLVLRGVPVPDWVFVNGRRRKLRAWANAELAIHRTYVALVIGCGVHASRDLPPAQRSQLMKLRGDSNTDARMRIARCLGVRTGAELGRVRRAAEVWSAMPA